MASSNSSNFSNTNYYSTAITTSTGTVWSMIFSIVQVYFVPVLVANALVGNSLIIALTSTPNSFSMQMSFTVRAYYTAFAITDLVTVVFYNLLTWLGMSKTFV